MRIDENRKSNRCKGKKENKFRLNLCEMVYIKCYVVKSTKQMRFWKLGRRRNTNSKFILHNFSANNNTRSCSVSRMTSEVQKVILRRVFRARNEIS